MGWERSQQLIKRLGQAIFILQTLKLFAEWCWKSEMGQIGWFCPKFLELFLNIKIAQKYLMSSRDLYPNLL